MKQNDSMHNLKGVSDPRQLESHKYFYKSTTGDWLCPYISIDYMSE